MTERPEPHPYDIYVNEAKAPKWIASFDAEERRQQYAEDVMEGKTVVKMLTGIALIGLLLGVIVLSYTMWIGTP
jgi:hypothetical protein